MTRKTKKPSSSPWFFMTGSNYAPSSWQGWVLIAVAVVVIAAVVAVIVTLSGGQVFH
ncbi:hypothetical protein [Humibacter ginsengiterrae]